MEPHLERTKVHMLESGSDTESCGHYGNSEYGNGRRSRSVMAEYNTISAYDPLKGYY